MIVIGKDLIKNEIELLLLRNTLDNTRFKRSDVEYSTVSQILGCDLGDSITLSQLSQRQGVNI